MLQSASSRAEPCLSSQPGCGGPKPGASLSSCHLAPSDKGTQPGVLGTSLSSHTSLAEDHSKLPVHFGVSFPLFPFIPGPASPLCAAACAHEQGLSRAPGGCFYPTSRCFPQAGPKDAPEGGRAQGAAPGGADVGTPPLSCSTQIPGISVLVSCSSSSAPPHCPSSEGQGRK